MSHGFRPGDIVRFERDLSGVWGVVRSGGYAHGPCVDWLFREDEDRWFQQDGCLADDVRLYDGDEAAVPDHVIVHSMRAALMAK